MDSPHTDFYVLGCLSAAVPLFAVVFQLLFCVVDRQKAAVDAVLSHLPSKLLFYVVDWQKAAADAEPVFGDSAASNTLLLSERHCRKST